MNTGPSYAGLTTPGKFHVGVADFSHELVTPGDGDVTRTVPMPKNHLKPEDDAHLREALKRCSSTTYLAAREFRKTGSVDHVPAIVHGVIERYVDREVRGKLRAPHSELRLAEDLGLDSLSMMEIVMLAEEVLRITIDNDELRRLRTLGDVTRFVQGKLRGAPAAFPS